MKAEQILAHPIARHVAAPSNLDIDNLSEPERSFLVIDAGHLLGATLHPTTIVDGATVLHHVAAIREHMAEAEKAAPVMARLWAKMQPTLDAAEKLAQRYQEAFPRRGGRLYVADAVAKCFVEIYAKRRGEPMTGAKDPACDAYTSDCLNRLHDVVACLKAQTRNGTVTDVGNRAIRKFKGKKR